MKVRFKVRMETGEDKKLKLNVNKKFMHEFTHNFIFYKFVNASSSQAIVLLGSIDDKNYYLVATIPFVFIFENYKVIGADRHKFIKKGFPKKMLEAMVDKIIMPKVSEYNQKTFMEFINSKG